MHDVFETAPWLHESLQSLDIRKGERVLQLTGHHVQQSRAILELIGRDGTLVVLEPDEALADRVRAIGQDGMHVIAIQPDGTEEFGRFDAVFACPSWNVGWPLERWGEIVRRGLRPGGRFVLDHPGSTACEPLAEVWSQLETSEPARWTGPTADEWTDALVESSLRGVEVAPTTHLTRFESPGVFADYALAGLDADDAQETLALGLTSAFGTNGEIDAVVHRTVARGMR